MDLTPGSGSKAKHVPFKHIVALTSSSVQAEGREEIWTKGKVIIGCVTVEFYFIPL